MGRPLGLTLDGRRRGWGGFRFKLRNNKRRSLGPEWSLSEVGTPTPHDLDIPHGLVASCTHTHIYYIHVLPFPNGCVLAGMHYNNNNNNNNNNNIHL